MATPPQATVRTVGTQAPPAPAGNGNQSGHGAQPTRRPRSGPVRGQPGRRQFFRISARRPGSQRHDLDPGLGNGRRRRRRNREKPTRPAEREFTAQTTEVAYTGELVPCSGLLDLREEGYGFLRTNGYLASAQRTSTFRSRRSAVTACARATWSEGSFRPAANNEKYPALVEGRVCSRATSRRCPENRSRKFESLTPLFPRRQVEPSRFLGEPGNVTAR